MTSTSLRPGTAVRRNPVAMVLLADGSSHRWAVNLTTWAAAALMVVSGYIHLHLYDIGYRHIATIGALFLVQGVASMVLAVGASVIRRVWSALIGAATMLATLTAFLISVNYGLFGWQDAFSATNAVDAFVIEIVSAVLFLAAVGVSLTGRTARTASADGPARA